MTTSFLMLGMFLAVTFTSVFFQVLLSLSLSQDSCYWNVGILQKSETVFISFYSLFCLTAVIFTVLSSSSLICFSSSVSMLLIPSNVFFISVIVFFISVLYFFQSFVKHFLPLFVPCLSFPRLRITFAIITLNSFSSRLPVSTSLSFSSGVLSCSFISDILSAVLFCLNFLKACFLFFRLPSCSSPCFRSLPSGG